MLKKGVQGLRRHWVQGSGFRITLGLGFGVWGLEFGVWGLGFRAQALNPTWRFPKIRGRSSFTPKTPKATTQEHFIRHKPSDIATGHRDSVWSDALPQR